MKINLNYDECVRALDVLYEQLNNLVSRNNELQKYVSELEKTIKVSSNTALYGRFVKYSESCLDYYQNIVEMNNMLNAISTALENYKNTSSSNQSAGNINSMYASNGSQGNNIYEKNKEQIHERVQQGRENAKKEYRDRYGNDSDYI